MKKTQHNKERIFAPVKALTQRFAYGLLVVLAFALMLTGRVDPRFVEGIRVHVTDAVSPIIDVMSRPLDGISELFVTISSITDAQLQNERLKMERDTLLHWRHVAQQLEAQNKELRNLLKFNPDNSPKFISARVIGDAGGAFAHTLLVNAGEKNGVRKGQAVATGNGLVGRIQEVGNLSARILLITDLNSRIPVIIEATRVRAVLAGNNQLKPRLIHLSPGSIVSPGDKVVTSGHAGAFPPGLPVGEVSSTGDLGIQVKAFVDASRIEYVRVFDFGMTGILPAPEFLQEISSSVTSNSQ